MKSSVVLLAICLVLAGCQDQADRVFNPGSRSGTQPEMEFQKGGEIYGTLTEAAKYLAQHEQVLAAHVSGKMRKAPATLSELGVNQFDARIRSSEARHYEIAVETSPASTLKRGEPLRVALDPDRFHAGESSFPAYVFDASQNKIRVENMAQSQSAGETLPFPLVLVTVLDRTEISLAEVAKRSKVLQARRQLRRQTGKPGSMVTAYLGVTKIRLRNYKDFLSFEEFELYVKEGTGATDSYHPTTIHKFDGTNRLDAAGRQVYYPDINLIDSIYVMQQPIALWPLSDSIAISISALEDDCISGEHRNWDYPSPYIKGLNEYHRPSNAVRFNIQQRFNLTGEGGLFSNDDDTYDNGTFSAWTAGNAPAEEFSVMMGDVEMWFKKIETLHSDSGFEN